jgi:hypothetical protein
VGASFARFYPYDKHSVSGHTNTSPAHLHFLPRTNRDHIFALHIQRGTQIKLQHSPAPNLTCPSIWLPTNPFLGALVRISTVKEGTQKPFDTCLAHRTTQSSIVKWIHILS